MSDIVRRQYEAFPYPARDPADEARRLVTGSPSDPHEIDHHLFGGRRDWSAGFRVLVAGGGTGDGLIQLAQKLAWAGVPHEITYIDLSRAARKIAKARAKARGLDSIRWVTGSLLDAADHGPFDYIDCCGVLHHLPDPAAGAEALKAALAPGGGMGLMVYAPHGRSGVYPLQAAFRTQFGHLPEAAQVEGAKALLARLPKNHPFRLNPHLNDHKTSDAGFYDLLLHSQDQAFEIEAFADLLQGCGLGFSPVPPALYDPARFIAPPPGLTAQQRQGLAERLDGTMKVHIGYAKEGMPTLHTGNDLVPHLRLPAEQAAKQIAAKGDLPLRLMGQQRTLRPPREAADMIARIDGRRPVSEIAADKALWLQTAQLFAAWNLLHYSSLPPVRS